MTKKMVIPTFMFFFIAIPALFFGFQIINSQPAIAWFLIILGFSVFALTSYHPLMKEYEKAEYITAHTKPTKKIKEFTRSQPIYPNAFHRYPWLNAIIMLAIGFLGLVFGYIIMPSNNIVKVKGFEIASSTAFSFMVILASIFMIIFGSTIITDWIKNTEKMKKLVKRR